jgi:WXG100 family type VII secretion target
MPSQGMQSDTELMAAAAADADGVAQTLTATLNTLMSNLEPMATEWQGAGGNAFQTVKGAIEDEIRNLNQALHFLAGEVGASGTTYVSTDDDMSSTVTGVGADGTITTSLRRG